MSNSISLADLQQTVANYSLVSINRWLPALSHITVHRQTHLSTVRSQIILIGTQSIGGSKKKQIYLGLHLHWPLHGLPAVVFLSSPYSSRPGAVVYVQKVFSGDVFKILNTDMQFKKPFADFWHGANLGPKVGSVSWGDQARGGFKSLAIWYLGHCDVKEGKVPEFKMPMAAEHYFLLALKMIERGRPVKNAAVQAKTEQEQKEQMKLEQRLTRGKDEGDGDFDDWTYGELELSPQIKLEANTEQQDTDTRAISNSKTPTTSLAPSKHTRSDTKTNASSDSPSLPISPIHPIITEAVTKVIAGNDPASLQISPTHPNPTKPVMKAIPKSRSPPISPTQQPETTQPSTKIIHPAESSATPKPTSASITSEEVTQTESQPQPKDHRDSTVPRPSINEDNLFQTLAQMAELGRELTEKHNDLKRKIQELEKEAEAVEGQKMEVKKRITELMGMGMEKIDE